MRVAARELWTFEHKLCRDREQIGGAAKTAREEIAAEKGTGAACELRVGVELSL